ncbi:ZIP zinc transporter [Hirsutella rhossiliensis]|uniref:ZIP zinc transporter domain-containing protein n=1 Tax=Hirsutella rhossiliensis TaxID=111463 RepID=A0A9P8MRN2_9HYPO|nr:ZIP zinc transporter domain-containing protein [Hirsutella rhossiliensis]KAH0959970.1 ZIP zinc transporter domain-containing protein [Hirsutella rhossiliensis]
MFPTHIPPDAVGHHFLLPRQGTDLPAVDQEADQCQVEALQLGRQGLRIASIFIILVASLIGALLPIMLSRQSRMHVPKSTFFICKFVGTGVIIATAWMHLLAPAVEQLGDKCVAQKWPSMGSYPWALCIPLMTIMVMFLVELLASRSGDDGDGEDGHGTASDSETDPNTEMMAKKKARSPSSPFSDDVESGRGASIQGSAEDVSYPPTGEGNVARGNDHNKGDGRSNMAGQLTAIFILEFGVVFHSVFIGLTLGTTAENELVVLFIVLIFHQMFEGLGLGSRLALAPWPQGRGWVPYVLALAFGLSTPIGIAAGMGAKPSNAATQKLINGIFDSISAGILMYTGLVELLAHEFMLNPRMRRAPLRIQLSAFACVALGVAIMALLAKWA